MKQTCIRIINLTTRESASLLVELLNGKTYMDFKISLVPIGGSFDVIAETNYDAPEDEIKDMLLGFLAYEFCKKNTEMRGGWNQYNNLVIEIENVGLEGNEALEKIRKDSEKGR